MIPQIVERLSKFPVIENCPSKNRERNSAAVLVILKDFNSECVFVRDLYHYLKDDNIIINEKNEDQMEIKIIDSFADEHIFKYEDKLIL